MKLNEYISIFGNGVGYVLASLQTNDVLKIIEFILSITLTLVILFYRLWRWYKEASKDGKITKDELNELGKIVEETKEDLDDEHRKNQ